MKKSHRKDVIIARIIFAILCLILIAIIVGAVYLVRQHKSKEPQQPQTQQTQQQTQTPDTTMVDPGGDTTQMDDTQDDGTQSAEETYMWTTNGVNLRSEPNTDCAVVLLLDKGTQVRVISEENGWSGVIYDGREGYIRSDYLTLEP